MRGWRRSVPWTVSARTRACTASAGQAVSPKWACTTSGARAARCRGERRPQLARRRHERAAARRELVQLDLEPVEAPQRADLVAHEAPALGMGGVGEHVGDDERAHDAPTVALWNDGPHERAQLRSRPGELRPAEIEPGFMRTATGSALISIGETRVICTASAQESVPRWMAGRGRGWVTAEYGMLPASTGERKQRDATRGRQDGRTVEIQRLIGRSLRGVVDFEALGERTIYLDCDVLQADGGTRCASITGAYVALSLACARLRGEGRLERSPLTGSVAAVSCGMIDGTALLDLDYPEDSTAEVDANVVMTGDGRSGRGAGDRRAHAALARAPRRAAGARRRRHRAAAREPRSRRSRRARPSAWLAVPASCCWRPTTSTSGASSSGCSRGRLRRWALAMLARRGRAAARGRGDVRRERPRQGARGGARAARRASIADDSGIAAAALGGAPGVRSARYAGEQASDGRTWTSCMREAPAGSALEYVCVIAYVDPAAGARAPLRGPLRRPPGAAAARRARLRLRPGVPARRRARAG